MPQIDRVTHCWRCCAELYVDISNEDPTCHDSRVSCERAIGDEISIHQARIDSARRRLRSLDKYWRLNGTQEASK